MLWLEMSNIDGHGGGDWARGKTLWSPTRKTNGDKSGFWETMLRVREGDVVLHLFGEGHNAAFSGFSIAASDGFETTERPPNPGKYDYSERFYRVLLRDFTPFPDPVLRDTVFQHKDSDLRRYFEKNNKLPRLEKKRIFYAVQGGQLQFQFGAYLTEMDEDLASIVFGSDYSWNTTDSKSPAVTVNTGVHIRQMKARSGQQDFSKNVRANFNSRCCFPGCEVAEDSFLVGAHIARWADEETLRGNTSNGLCLCLMHDKAFELGLFTINSQLSICVNYEHPQLSASSWCRKYLIPYTGQKIKPSEVPPSIDSLRLHWERVSTIQFV